MAARLVVAGLPLAVALTLVACGQPQDGTTAPAAVDRVAACSAAGDAMEDAERLAGEAMGGGTARVSARLAEVTTALRSAAEGDADLDAALERHADQVTAAVEALAGTDPAKVAALDTDAVEASEAAVRKLCDLQGPSPAAADQGMVREVCAKVTATEKGDGVEAAALWKAVRGASATTKDRTALAGLWRGMSEVYDDGYYALPVDAKSIADFRSALFQVASAYEIAAGHLGEADGAAKARDYLDQETVKAYFATVKERCGG
jgi:hypothetical protein